MPKEFLEKKGHERKRNNTIIENVCGRKKYLLRAEGPTIIPNLSNSVYSMQDNPYVHFPSKVIFSSRTLMPSVAPELRLHEANPNF